MNRIPIIDGSNSYVLGQAHPDVINKLHAIAFVNLSEQLVNFTIGQKAPNQQPESIEVFAVLAGHSFVLPPNDEGWYAADKGKELHFSYDLDPNNGVFRGVAFCDEVHES